MGYRVGIDVGGTFTDLIAVQVETGQIVSTKVQSTPANPADGFIDSLVQSNIPSAEIDVIVHGTTVGTNALIERRGPKVGFLCTSGFRDLLETRREWREKLYDVHWEKPRALVPRRLRREVVERVDSRGEVVTPLSDDSVKAAIQLLKEEGANCYAISLLWSFLNPDHEHRVRDLIQEIDPGASVSLSVDVNPQIKEYERASATVIDAFLKPIVSSYVEEVTQRLKGLGIDGPLWLMKPNGGVMTADAARKRPLDTLASGPAGGVTASVHLGKTVGVPNLITFDMGGTSADVCLVFDHMPLLVNERDLEWNIPVRMPMMEIISIGAGGGSIGWVDKGGALQVGPQSAGADPGPACYNRGGTEATVTDAKLVLGRLDPEYFLGGTMSVDVEAARTALAKVGAHFGWGAEECAFAIHKISLGKMAQLLREVTVVRGFDPRDFRLVSFGGAGGAFAAEIADEVGIPEVICPSDAGVYSASGCLFADMVLDLMQTYITPAVAADLDTINAHVQRMTDAALAELASVEIEAQPAVEVLLDLRYFGEVYEITTPLESISRAGLAQAAQVFHGLHEQFYGFGRPEEPVEMVNLRLRASLPTEKPRLRHAGNEASPDTAQTSVRNVCFERAGNYLPTPIYERHKLPSGAVLQGPAVIEDPQTTVIVPPGFDARVDEFGNIRISKRPEGSGK